MKTEDNSKYFNLFIPRTKNCHKKNQKERKQKAEQKNHFQNCLWKYLREWRNNGWLNYATRCSYCYLLNNLLMKFAGLLITSVWVDSLFSLLFMKTSRALRVNPFFPVFSLPVWTASPGVAGRADDETEKPLDSWSRLCDLTRRLFNLPSNSLKVGLLMRDLEPVFSWSWSHSPASRHSTLLSLVSLVTVFLARIFRLEKTTLLPAASNIFDFLKDGLFDLAADAENY